MKVTRFQIYRRIMDKGLSSYIEIPIKYAIFNGIATGISAIISLISPYLYKIFIDNVMTNGELNILKYIIAAMVGVFFLLLLCSFVSTRTLMIFNNKVNLKVKKKIFSRIIYKDIVEHAQSDVGNYHKLIENESIIISEFFNEQIIGVFIAALFSIVYFVLLLFINPWLSLLILVTLPITMFFGKYIGKKFNIYNNNLREIEATNNNYLLDTIQKWREIKANTIEDSLVDKYEKRLEPEKSINLKWMKFHALEKLYYAVKNDFTENLLLYCVGGLFIAWGQITIGNLLMFISYTHSLSTNIDTIISLSTKFKSNQAVFDRFFSILEIETEYKPMVTIQNLDIELSDVSFAYSNNLPIVINHTSFTFTYGCKYLIIGKSGEGKSTLLKLLLHMYNPLSGKILLGGIDIKQLQESIYFNLVGVVMQENYFFNLSIKENLLMLTEDVNEDDINEAIRFACLEEFIMALPEKYDTVIGERGIKLSGGQKQRLAIARMILHKPKIIILDEATSALDSITESKILSNLSLMKDKTIIFISHKPALQMKFDKKISFDKGSLQEVEDIRFLPHEKSSCNGEVYQIQSRD